MFVLSPDESLTLIDAGEVDEDLLPEGKNIYYVKVRMEAKKPIAIASPCNTLRVGPTLGTSLDCTLTSGSWVPKDAGHPTDPAYSYTARLQADLNTCGAGMSPTRSFTVSYDDSLSSPPEGTDRQLTIAAVSGNFALDLDYSGDVECSAAALGFAPGDHDGATSYTGDDQLQPYTNAEYVWSSPIWVDYTPN